MKNEEGKEIIASIIAEHGECPILEVDTGFDPLSPYIGQLISYADDCIVLWEDIREKAEEKAPIYFRNIQSIRYVPPMELVHRVNLLRDEASPVRGILSDLCNIGKAIKE